MILVGKPIDTMDQWILHSQTSYPIGVQYIDFFYINGENKRREHYSSYTRDGREQGTSHARRRKTPLQRRRIDLRALLLRGSFFLFLPSSLSFISNHEGVENGGRKGTKVFFSPTKHT